MMTKKPQATSDLGVELEHICDKSQGASSRALEQIRLKLVTCKTRPQCLHLLLTELASAHAEEPSNEKKNTLSSRDIQIQALMYILRMDFAVKYDEAASLLTGGESERFQWHQPHLYIAAGLQAA